MPRRRAPGLQSFLARRAARRPWVHARRPATDRDIERARAALSGQRCPCPLSERITARDCCCRRIVQKGAQDRYHAFMALIDTVPMLMSLRPHERMKLCDALVPRYHQRGDCIVSAGDGMHFVEEGVVGVFVTSDTGKRVRVNRIGKGGYFGELSLITGHARPASVYAECHVKLAFLDAAAFERMLGPCMEILKRDVHNYTDQLAAIFGSEHD